MKYQYAHKPNAGLGFGWSDFTDMLGTAASSVGSAISSGIQYAAPAVIGAVLQKSLPATVQQQQAAQTAASTPPTVTQSAIKYGPYIALGVGAMILLMMNRSRR